VTDDGIKLEFFVEGGTIIVLEDGIETGRYTPREFLAKIAENTILDTQ
jgi:hypothetical protein